MTEPLDKRSTDGAKNGGRSDKFNRLIMAVFVFSAAYTILVFWAASKFKLLGISLDFKEIGPFGDSFGPLNTFMAGVAAVAAVRAYIAQRDALVQAKADSKANEELSTKRDFETTFFNLLSLFRATAKEISIRDLQERRPEVRPNPFRLFLSEHVGNNIINQDFQSAYRVAYRNNRDEMGHYFRLFYHLLKFIDSSSIRDKYLYSRILRATLSNSEMVVIGLNCVYGSGREKLKPLVELYSMLHNISQSDANEWFLTLNFSSLAFGDRDMGNNGTNCETD